MFTCLNTSNFSFIILFSPNHVFAPTPFFRLENHYQTSFVIPTVMSYTIQELRSVCLWASGGMQEYPTQDMDEVHPSLFLGNAASARDIERLRRQNIGYVMNAAHGTDASLNQMIVHPKEVYQAAGIEYCGIPAIDMMSYPLYEHFGEATEFIRKVNL